MPKIVNAYKVRCDGCPNLQIVKGVWTCDECFGQKCEEIDDCPEGVTAEEVQEIEQRAKENKVQHEATATGEKKEKKPRERKPDEEKESLISGLAGFLATQNYSNVNITNISKVIEFDIGENHYKLDLIRQNKNLLDKKKLKN